MSTRDARPLPWIAAALTALLTAAGCASPGVPPPVARGTPCVACGMSVQDLRFACQRRVGRAWRVYDAIECLLRDAQGDGAIASAWLADYDRQTLHEADSMWVVRGEFPSPMGGGLAAFRTRAAAESVAAATRGRVDRLGAFLSASPEPAR
jgi:nitrous oxide reductase accessory protein NosL